MQKQCGNTAVLFFSRSPKAEGKSKQLIHSTEHKNTRIAEALIRHSRRQISDSGLPCYTFDEEGQRGLTFAERFTNAFKDIFSKGFEYVIAIGNDTPGLKADHLIKASQRLASGESDVVLGPATDGGTWLMGYSRYAFDADAFQQLPWNSSYLLNEVLSQSPEECTITLLKELADIDDHASLRQFIHTFYGDWSLARLARQIQSVLFSTVSSFVEIVHSYLLNHIFKSHLRRGPPLRSAVPLNSWKLKMEASA